MKNLKTRICIDKKLNELVGIHLRQYRMQQYSVAKIMFADDS